MLSRRDAMTKLAAGTAAACVVGVAGSSLASTGPEAASAAPTDPAPGPEYTNWPVVDAGAPETMNAAPNWDLLSPLAMGSAVTQGWRVSGLTGVANGSCVLTLENERGRSHRVHICRNDGRPQGVVYTKQFDLLVMNGGLGDLPTEEGFAQAVAEVAHVLAANEGRREVEPVTTALLSHAERIERFADAARLR